MFGFLKRNKLKTEIITAPVTGNLINITAVQDDVFSEKMMGDGFAVIPNEGNVFAPVVGKITTIFPTQHAIGIKTAFGLEVLVHMGLDTVELEGKPFKTLVHEDDTVTAETQLVEMDVEQVKKLGKDPTVVIIFTNMDQIISLPEINKHQVTHGIELGMLTLK
ncbi:PTS sugar transporter subunit IIA [Loigolactobacillus coryniformis]|uniref:Phosphotransferase system IIA component n=1 Tax=Loigolactobacillus coryniformis subsp. coryniformis CECT 5711 TaxID=1185325 RepID=J2Z6B0_9LACO|nr:PTS glucose transporter subunit IIA [Loigolactobacillus coryniformis]EJN56093.1 Phosphotransferase system IIA component [Loigolactobacillus coryniformis subsp. coryniformis CECT 5711]